MKNVDIILHESIILMNKGIIGTNGFKMTVEAPNGTKKEIDMPEEIHTYRGWKARGYQVQKGQKAIAQFPIWKHVTKKAKKEDEEDEQRMFMKMSSFFKKSQVERIGD